MTNMETEVVGRFRSRPRPRSRIFSVVFEDEDEDDQKSDAAAPLFQRLVSDVRAVVLARRRRINC